MKRMSRSKESTCRAGTPPGSHVTDPRLLRHRDATVRYLYAWLSAEIARLCDVHGKGRGRTWRHSFCLGAVSAIRTAMNAAKTETRQTAGSAALVALDRRDVDAKALLAGRHPDLKPTRSGQANDRDAFKRGEEAGRAIHLGNVIPGAQPAPMLRS